MSGDYDGFVLLVVLFVVWLAWQVVTDVILPWIKHRSRGSIFHNQDSEDE